MTSGEPELDRRLAAISAEIAALRAELCRLRPAPEPALASVREAAVYLGVSVRGVEARIHSGELVSRRVGRRRLVPWAALRRYAAADHPAPCVGGASK